MLRLLTLALLVAAAAAQRYYYCNSNTPSVIGDNEFYLLTRTGQNDSGYPPELACEFNAKTDIGYLVEIIKFQVATATLTISSLSETAFHGSSLPAHQSSIVTTNSGHLRISFNAAMDSSRSPGVTIRVRAFNSNGCPPGWVSLYGNCFGTSGRRLNYFDAQSACNSMKANLLHIPLSYIGSLGSFMRMLPSNLRMFYTWIGLTDRTSSGQFAPYWLSGQRQFDTSEISCVSGGRYSSCYSVERCATFNDKGLFYSVYMGQCAQLNSFACSMQSGGSRIFYTVPGGVDYVYSSTQGAIWGAVIGCLAFVSVTIGVIYACVRSSHAKRAIGATSVVVTTGRVIVPPPGVAYPATQLHPPQYNGGASGSYPSTYNAQPPLYHSPPPPAYTAAYGKRLSEISA